MAPQSPPAEAQRGPATTLAGLDAEAQALARACRVLIQAPSVDARPPREPAMAARIAAVEAALDRRFAAELALPRWHGPTSYQRMIWQDPEVLALVAAPGAVDTLLDGLAAGRSRPIGRVNLAGALVAGLAVNRPSYLFGACPNWAALPNVAVMDLDPLDDMRPPTAARQAKPFRVTETLAADARVALRAFAARLVPTPDAADRRAALWSAIGEASPARLVAALASLLTPARLDALVHDREVASTAPPRMRGQCLEVMSLWPALCAALQSDLEAALGFGLVSHALDAKHLAAMLGGAARPAGRAGAAAFDALIGDLVADRLDDAPAALLTARLRQAAQLLADRAGRLGVATGEIERALRS